MPLPAAIRAVVKVGSTVSPAEVAATVLKGGFQTTARNFGMMVSNALAKLPDFRREGRGQYLRVAGAGGSGAKAKTKRKPKAKPKAAPKKAAARRAGRKATAQKATAKAPPRRRRARKSVARKPARGAKPKALPAAKALPASGATTT